jgi:hypothetical protein
VLQIEILRLASTPFQDHLDDHGIQGAELGKDGIESDRLQEYGVVPQMHPQSGITGQQNQKRVGIRLPKDPLQEALLLVQI